MEKHDAKARKPACLRAFQKKNEKNKKNSKKVLTKYDSHGSIYKLSRETADKTTLNLDN